MKNIKLYLFFLYFYMEKEHNTSNSSSFQQTLLKNHLMFLIRVAGAARSHPFWLEPEPPEAAPFGWSRSRFFSPAPPPTPILL